jgi:SMI1-KNR4 cell-wall
MTGEMIHHTEQKSGYKLPNSYIDLVKVKNGGIPVNMCFTTTTATSMVAFHQEQII